MSAILNRPCAVDGTSKSMAQLTNRRWSFPFTVFTLSPALGCPPVFLLSSFVFFTSLLLCLSSFIFPFFFWLFVDYLSPFLCPILHCPPPHLSLSFSHMRTPSHARARARTHTHTHTHTHSGTRTHAHKNARTDTHASTNTRTHTHKHDRQGRDRQ